MRSIVVVKQNQVLKILKMDKVGDSIYVSKEKYNLKKEVNQDDVRECQVNR